MNLVHVVPHINEEASGPSYSVPRLCESLAARGHTVELSCLAASGRVPGVSLDVHPQWRVLPRLAISLGHAKALRSKAETVDVIHNHSLWSMVNIAAGWVVPGRRAKLVVSPRGTLSTWALNRRRSTKSLLWPWQRRALERAGMLHATSEAEYLEIRAQNLNAPVAVIPNGVDVPPSDTRRRRLGKRVLLFLGRIHPTKGIVELLDAWSQIEATHPDWTLVIAGKGEVQDELKARERSAALGLQRVEFRGPLYGPAKSAAYFEAELFILPSHSENFGMTVAEALAHARPTIVTKGAPWSGLERESCGWWVENDLHGLTGALDLALKLPPDRLTVMGERGRLWMTREFSWQTVAEKMELAYRYILDGTQAPTFMRVD